MMSSLSDPDPIPDDLASYRNNAGQETENTSNEEEKEATNDNTGILGLLWLFLFSPADQ